MKKHLEKIEQLRQLSTSEIVIEAKKYIAEVRSKLKPGMKAKYFNLFAWMHDQIDFRALSLDNQLEEMATARKRFEAQSHLLPAYIREQRISVLDAFVARPLADCLPEILKDLP